MKQEKNGLVTALTVVIMTLLVAVDQMSKAAVLAWLKPRGTAPVIPGFLQLHYAENTGVAFGMLPNGRVFFIVVTAVVMIAALYLMFSGKIKNRIAYFSAALIVAGGLGNWIDRVFRGFVVDFFEPQFMEFAIFNFADCLVTVGAVGLIGYLAFDLVRELRLEKQKKAAQK